MIKEFKKTIGYICPYCSTINLRQVNLFDFSGSSGLSFHCRDLKYCGGLCMKMTPKKDKYSITIECPVCDEPHSFNIGKVHFWQNKLFALNCPETGVGIFFAGDEERVRTELKEQEKLFLVPGDDYTIANELGIIFEAVERINSLAKEGCVSCSCQSRAIAIEIDNEKITLCCRDCGNSMEIPATREGLDKLLNTSTIVLD